MNATIREQLQKVLKALEIVRRERFKSAHPGQLARVLEAISDAELRIGQVTQLALRSDAKFCIEETLLFANLKALQQAYSGWYDAATLYEESQSEAAEKKLEAGGELDCRMDYYEMCSLLLSKGIF